MDSILVGDSGLLQRDVGGTDLLQHHVGGAESLGEFVGQFLIGGDVLEGWRALGEHVERAMQHPAGAPWELSAAGLMFSIDELPDMFQFMPCARMTSSTSWRPAGGSSRSW